MLYFVLNRSSRNHCPVLMLFADTKSVFFPTAILRVVSAVLLFGNMVFKQESRNSDQATMPDDTGME